jgi:hypothetical protein
MSKNIMDRKFSAFLDYVFLLPISTYIEYISLHTNLNKSWPKQNVYALNFPDVKIQERKVDPL